MRRVLRLVRKRASDRAVVPAALLTRVRTAFRLDDEHWAQLVHDVRSVQHRWTEAAWLAPTIHDRTALWCTAQDRRDWVELIAETTSVHGRSFLVDRESLTIDLGLGIDVPRWLTAAQARDLVLVTKVEVAGGEHAVVAGTSFISGIAFDPQHDRVQVTADGSGDLEVVMRPDALADADSGERWADQSAASWWARFDRRRPRILTVSVTSAGVNRTTKVEVPAASASAVGVAAQKASANGVATHEASAVGVAAQKADELLLDSEAPVDVEIASDTGTWTSEKLPASVAVNVPSFGHRRPVPTGRYALQSGNVLDLADPEVLIRPLAEREIELDSVCVTLRGWTPKFPAASLVVRTPIPHHHRGRRRQRRLLNHVSARAVPLEDRAVAMSFGGVGGGDNSAAVARELAARGIPVSWCVRDHSIAVPEGTEPVLLHSRQWHEALARSRYLINNAEFPHYVRFREGQRYLQLWHGTPLKRIANDIENSQLSAGYTRAMRREVVAWEALAAQNHFAGEVLPRAFGFTGRTLVEGYPRNDALSGDRGLRARERTRAELGLGDELVVLYAPTWRDSARTSNGRRAFTTHLDAARVHDELGATVLVRSHANTAATRGRIDGPGVVDVTSHPDVTALIAASDVLITDYSSIMFDFAVTERPMIFLAPDVERYRDVERGFYLDFEEVVPGPVVTTNDDVIAELAVLSREDDGSRARDLARFRERFASLDDGSAARRVVDAWIGAGGQT